METKSKIFATAIILLSLLAVISCTNTKNEKPNVVIFLTDDQGTLDVNCYGSVDLHTPNMDRLCREGIRFTQAYVYQFCCPTRAALLTGRSAHRGGVTNWTQGDAHAEKGINMDLEEITIAEVLKDQGYKTGLFGKWHLGADLEHGPTSQGFDYFFGFRGGFIDNFNHHFLHGKGFHDLYRNKEELFMKGEYFPDLMTREAIRFITENKNKSMFLYIAFNLPHYPEQSDTKFDEIYADISGPRQSYAKAVSTVDDRMGQIMDHMEELDLYENTLFIFMSDNGHSCELNQIRVHNHTSGLPNGHRYGANGGGGNTGKWYGKKGTYFEGGVRVPYIISFPKELPADVARDQIVRDTDVLPTICDILQIPVPDKKLDGSSLLPVIQDNAETHHDALFWGWADSWAVREGEWKLIVNGRNPPDLAKGEYWENTLLDSIYLANLAEKGPEKINHANDHPNIVERLTQLHTDWLKGNYDPIK
jgi:arylsulfatase A-like enzyme